MEVSQLDTIVKYINTSFLAKYALWILKKCEIIWTKLFRSLKMTTDNVILNHEVINIKPYTNCLKFVKNKFCCEGCVSEADLQNFPKMMSFMIILPHTWIANLAFASLTIHYVSKIVRSVARISKNMLCSTLQRVVRLLNTIIGEKTILTQFTWQ